MVNQMSFFSQFSMGLCPQYCIPSPRAIGPLVLEKKIFKGFLSYMGLAAIWLRDPDVANKLSLPLHTEALYEIWL